MVQAFTISGVNLSPSHDCVTMIRAGNKILRWYVEEWPCILPESDSRFHLCCTGIFVYWGVFLKYSPETGTTWKGDFGLPDVAQIRIMGIVMPGTRLDRYAPFKRQKSDAWSDREQGINH
jgi:hypothetical protein